MSRGRHTPPRLLALILVAALPSSAAAASELRQIVPGVNYERREQPGQVTHIMRVVPSSLIEIRPVLTAGAPTRRGTLTSAMRARLGDGAIVGVNGDYFNLDNAYPSGLLINGGEILHEPEASRSALVFPPDGQMFSLVAELTGRWQAIDPAGVLTYPERGFVGINRPKDPRRDSETVVYTSRYGELTPTGDRVDVLIDLDAPGTALVNRPLTGTVQTVKPGGGVGIGPGKLVIAGIGAAGNNVLNDLLPGNRVTLTFGIPGLPAGTAAAIGGGPALVNNGQAITTVTEGFTFGQITTRTSRTAVGQTADGTVLLVTSEGPFQGSRGITMAEQATLMASLGARTAIGMDGGGSAAMAVRDDLLIPWSSERAISDAVVVTYGGVSLTAPPVILSPNGDGILDTTRLTARSPKNGSVRITLTRRTGKLVRTLFTGGLGPSGRTVSLSSRVLVVPDGAYKVVARFTPSDGSSRTNHVQEFVVDRSIGHLRLQKFKANTATALRVRFRVGKSSRLTLVVKDAKGNSTKLLFRNRRHTPGNHSIVWDLKRAGKPLPAGIYTVSLRAETGQGRHILFGRVKVTTPPKPPANPPATP